MRWVERKRGVSAKLRKKEKRRARKGWREKGWGKEGPGFYSEKKSSILEY